MPRVRIPPVKTDSDNISQYLIGRIVGRALRSPILPNSTRSSNKSASWVTKRPTQNNNKQVMYSIEYYGYEDHPPEWVSREDIDPEVVEQYDAAAPIAGNGVRSRAVIIVVGVDRGGKEKGKEKGKGKGMRSKATYFKATTAAQPGYTILARTTPAPGVPGQVLLLPIPERYKQMEEVLLKQYPKEVSTLDAEIRKQREMNPTPVAPEKAVAPKKLVAQEKPVAQEEPLASHPPVRSEPDEYARKFALLVCKAALTDKALRTPEEAEALSNFSKWAAWLEEFKLRNDTKDADGDEGAANDESVEESRRV
ncbi:hypothetical protein H2199_008910 [Coniosporium tulheliwenetii]|uniref:Uncharacterized protein n=1 Tax=Coniosporium tulheliwenetii TaxID=3383036 RepID=A0ACC2YH07_9PEZI|nr:hypothetical protein H2199_008910 [Cladosporium sp. JES 115]